MKKSEFSNAYVSITFNIKEGSISGRDLTDMYNEPSFYTKSKRGIEKAWENIENSFSNTTYINDIYDILDSFSINYHSYCAVD